MNMIFVRDYNEYYNWLLATGKSSMPRGRRVVAAQNVMVDFPAAMIPRRKRDNPAIGIMEMLQLLAGVFDHEAIAAVAPNARLELFTEQSAYGPRLVGQLEAVVAELTADPASRRATAIIARPNEAPEERPCTTSLQFQSPGPGLLNLTVVMRSSDAVWGLPYDVVQFNGALAAVAVALRLSPYRLIFQLGNAHVYDATRVDPGSWYKDRLVTSYFKQSLRHTQVAAQRLIDARPGREELVEAFLVNDRWGEV